MGVALEEIERLGRLVDGLLVLSRADAGEMTLERVGCDLAQIAAQAIAAHAVRAEGCGIRVQLDGPAACPLVGDPTHGGRLRVESELGCGTVFTLELSAAGSPGG
jgi:signal transduction histidine kinase